MRRSTSPMGVGGYARSGSSSSTQQSIWERWRNAWPSVRGMRWFACAMTSGARRAAGSAYADTPTDRNPAASGGAVWTRTASGAHGPPAANRLTLSK